MAAERLADDLLIEILSRVPARSLCRFKCVSKHWLSLINHPDHRRKLPQTLAGFFYSRRSDADEEVFPLDSEFRFASVSGKICPPIYTSFAFLPVHHRGVDVLDCCNGLLLCRGSNVSAPGDEFCYIVCNPATEGWVQLPDPGHVGRVGIVRLGFDPAASSHFYVFVLLEYVEFKFKLGGMDVFSSETGRWVHKEMRWTEKMEILSCRPPDVFLNGCLHFHACGNRSSRCIGVVDTEGETWTSLSIPLYSGFIQQSQGYLHYANFQYDGYDDVAPLVVYVLEDYDSKEWILKHSVQTSHLFAGTNVTNSNEFLIHPYPSHWITIHPECNCLIFFSVGSSPLMCYDMDSRQVKVICNLDGYHPCLPYVPLYAKLQALHT